MKLKQKFDRNSLPLTFYAHTLEFIGRNSYEPRYAVRFEAVERARIEMFVSGRLPEELPPTAKDSAFFQEIWEYFQKGGFGNVDFLSRKDLYLGQAGNVELGLMLNSFSAAKGIANAENDWWEITVEPSKRQLPETEDSCVLAIPGYMDIEEEFPFSIRPVGKKEEQDLYRLYLTYSDGKMTGKNGTGPEQLAVGAILAATTFNEIRVFYVGAALSCCLVDGANNPIAYFDMGVENALSLKMLRKHHPNYLAMRQAAQNSYNAVTADAVLFPNMDVIISHWHTDHVSIANDMAQNFLVAGAGSVYLNFWQGANFIVPQTIAAKGWALTHATNIHGAMTAAGNLKYHAVPYVNANQCNNLGAGFANIDLYKCDRNDTGVRAPNPHDHGIFAVVNMISGNSVFLAGDCAYDTLSVGNPLSPILNHAGAGYHVLVASHHGGKYTHTTAHNKVQYIPVPFAAPPAVPEVFYSANGIAYGHPVPANVAAYAAAGWNGQFTHLLPPVGINMFLIH